MLKINNINKKRTKLYIAVAVILTVSAFVFAIHKNTPHPTFAEDSDLTSIEFQDSNLCKSIYDKLENSFSINNYCTETTPYLEMAENDILNVTSFDADGDEMLGGYSYPISNLSGIENFVNLKRLNLISASYNSITDISPLASLTSLEYLSLTDNPISDFSPLANLTKLTELYLESTSISSLSPLANLINLTDLRLDYNSISDLTPLNNLTNLEELWIRSNNISDISPLSNFTNLEHLELSDNSISDLTPLTNLTNLTNLDFDYNQVSSLSALSNLTNLTHLNLSNNAIFDYTPIENILPNISSLSYGGQSATVETSSEIYTLPAAFTQVKNSDWVGGKPHTDYDFILDNATLSNDEKEITFIDTSQPATIQIQYNSGTTDTNDILTVEYVASTENNEAGSDDDTGNSGDGSDEDSENNNTNSENDSTESDNEEIDQQVSSDTNAENENTTSENVSLSVPDTGKDGEGKANAALTTGLAFKIIFIIAAVSAIIYTIGKHHLSNRH